MGYAIAEELANQGAEVILISGPTNLQINHSNIQKVNIQTADEMFDAASKTFPLCDAAIMSAAVADYKSAIQFDKKVKRSKEKLQINLEPNKDIAAELGRIKRENQVLIGFALETDNEVENAIKKINNKNLNFIVLNSLNDKGAGFGHDTNKISIIDNKLNRISYDLKTKKEVAVDIVEELFKQMQ